MAQQLDYIEYMSQEIGPRPAGTEEEQQAALYIADTFQDETGFPAVIEDIVSSSNVKSPRAICSIVTALACIIALFVGGFVLPALLITLVSGALYAAESMGFPLLTKTLSNGASQNVVAKYQPASHTSSKRSRKIILVAHYDTGKVKPKLVTLMDSLPVPWDLVSFVGMLFIPFFLLLKLLFFANAQGIVAIITNIIFFVAIVAAVLPAVRAILYRLAPYSEGANDNAAGVAAMLGVAKTISQGLMNENEIVEGGEEAIVHSEEDAYENDLVPDGAEIVYNAPKNTGYSEEPQSEEERLMAAKAAIAALTGAPVSSTAYVSHVAEPAAPQIKVHDLSDDEPRIATYEASDLDGANAQSAASYTEVEEPELANAIAAEDNLAEAANFDGAETTFHEDVPRETSVADGSLAAGQSAAMSTAAPGGQGGSEANLPDWYVQAQKKAKRSSNPVKYAQRSRYADALDAAVSTSSSFFDEANRIVESESEERIRARSADIVEVLPPMPGEQRQASAHQVAQTAAAAPVQAEQPDPAQAVQSPWMPKIVQAPQETAAYDDVAPVETPNVDAVAQPAPEVQQPEAAPATSGETTAMPPITFSAEELAAFGANAEAVAAAPANSAVSSQSAALDDETPDFVSMGQRAPLADAVDKTGAKNRLSMLPAIDLANPQSANQDSPSRSGAMRSLRSNLPSFSGSLERIGDEDDSFAPSVSAVGSFGASGATGSFEPVGDELLEDVDPEDIYVDDADDSDLDDIYTESGAFAGPGYVDMPKSRVKRFLSKFHLGSKKNSEIEESPQEWLDVEDSFDPREVGRERGGWESFREEPSNRRRGRDDAYADDYYAEDDYEQPVEDAYADDYYDEPEPPARRNRRSRNWEGGALSRVRLGHVDTKSRDEDSEQPDDAISHDEIDVSDDIQQVYSFRNPNFATEVWFVALGSEIENHDGMKAFIEKHKSDLRGAIFIDVEALGAGDLALVQSEGALVQKRSSSRMKRYLQKASRSTGISFDTINMPGNESSASTAIAAGMQALHLVGADGNAKALTTADEDIFDNIDQGILEENTRFLEELIKSI